MNRTRAMIVALGATLVLAACGGGSGGSNGEGDAASAAPEAVVADSTSDAPTELARPAGLSDLPEVELVAPGESDAGVAPTFVWKSFTGAAAYRLSVMGPQRPIWSWTGEDTEVTLALQRADRSEYAPGLEIVTGSWWSVAALADDGSVLALSAFRAVSPGDAPDEPEPPAFMSGAQPAVEEEEPEAEPAAEPAADGELSEACDIVSEEEVAAAIGEVGDFGPAGYATGDGTDCSFQAAGREYGVDIELQPTTDAYRPQDWVRGEPDPVPGGLGDESYINNDGLSIRISWIHGEQSATVVAYTGDEAKLIELAKLIDSRLP